MNDFGSDKPEIFHLGIHTHNVEDTAARLSKALGISFRTVQDVTVPGKHKADGSPVGDHKGRYTMSYDGPIYFEVMSVPEDQPEGIHHIGVWKDNPEAYCLALVSEGVFGPGERTLMPTGLTASWKNDPATLSGIRIEFVNALARPILGKMLEERAEMPSRAPVIG